MNKSLVIIIIFITLSGYALAISPDYSIKASGGVYDFILEDNLLYAATDAGLVEVFDINTKKKIYQIKLPEIKDFTGEFIPVKIFSIDKIKGKEGIILTVQGSGGYRDVFYYYNNELSKIFDAEKDKLMVKRSSFINKDFILLGLLSNELILYNIKTKKQIYRKQLSTSVFSDFITDITRKLTITCEESGKLRFINIRT